MRGVIYVDILFFVNALIGYFLLRGAALLAAGCGLVCAGNLAMLLLG